LPRLGRVDTTPPFCISVFGMKPLSLANSPDSCRSILRLRARRPFVGHVPCFFCLQCPKTKLVINAPFLGGVVAVIPLAFPYCATLATGSPSFIFSFVAFPSVFVALDKDFFVQPGGPRHQPFLYPVCPLFLFSGGLILDSRGTFLFFPSRCSSPLFPLIVRKDIFLVRVPQLLFSLPLTPS